MIFINKIKTTECIFTTKNFRIQNKTKNKKKMHSEKKKIWGNKPTVAFDESENLRQHFYIPGSYQPKSIKY